MKVLAISFLFYHTCTAFVQIKAPVAFSTKTQLFGWGPEPIWDEATVVDVSPASSNSVSLTLDVGEEKVSSYLVPGQYCQVKIAGDDDAQPSFLAIASAPEEGSWQFLVKQTENNGWLTGANVGTKFDVSQILGEGFKMKENFDGFKYDFPTQRVLMFAAGSGIAPIRAAIESNQMLTSGRSARLYYGCRNLEEMAYKEKFVEWESKGVEVVPVFSQPSSANAPGRTGYVQTALEEDGVPTPRNCGAVLCGMKGMAESVTDLLKKSGMFDGRVLTNF